MSVSPYASGAFDFSGTSFLIVDDKPFFREMVHAALRGRTRNLRDAGAIDRAVEVLRRYGPDTDCIISDWDMLPRGGLDLLRMVRARLLPTVSPRTAYVILTARADTAAVRCAADLDVNGFAIAPLSIEKLLKTIAAGLRRTWLLNQPAHYVAVPTVTATPLSAETAAPPALTNVRICGIDAVRPGAILARDVHDPDGRLLLPIGTALDTGYLDRVRGAVQFVWVGERPDA